MLIRSQVVSLKMRKVLQRIPSVYAGFGVFPFQCFAMFCNWCVTKL